MNSVWLPAGLAVLVACSPGAGPSGEDTPSLEVASPSASGQVAPAGPAAVLMTADREFARATAGRGLEGWTLFFAADAARLEWKGAAHRGLEAIRAADGPLLSDPSIRLLWEPDDAGLFTGGRLGYTRGPYRLVRLDGAGEPGPVLARGRYLSIWRLDPEGWRVILDTGVAEASPQDTGAPAVGPTP